MMANYKAAILSMVKIRFVEMYIARISEIKLLTVKETSVILPL